MLSRSNFFRSLSDAELEKLWEQVVSRLRSPTPVAPRTLANAIAPFLFGDVFNRLSPGRRAELQEWLNAYERTEMEGYIPALVSACVSELDGRIEEAIREA